jgi:hypothetical protein
MYDLSQSVSKNHRYGKKCDSRFRIVLAVKRQLMVPPMKLKRKIGFDLKEKQAHYEGKMSS